VLDTEGQPVSVRVNLAADASAAAAAAATAAAPKKKKRPVGRGLYTI